MLRSGTIILVCLIACLTGCCVPGHPVESVRVLQDIAAGPKPTALKRDTPEPQRQTVSYVSGQRTLCADLYLPGNGAPEARLLLVPGVARAGYRDERLVAFAQTLARAKFAVLVPDFPNVRRLEVGPGDAREINAAFRHLVSLSGFGPPDRAGLVAASYAVGPTILAALEPDLQGRVKFILAVGGYYNLEETLTFAITGYYRDRTKPNPEWRHMDPLPYAKWVFLSSNLARVPSARDRCLLREIAQRKLDDPDASVDALTRRLGPSGRSFYNLLTTNDPDRVPVLLSRLPRAVQSDIRALNLADRDLSGLDLELILIHGRNDDSIPYTESKALAAAAPHVRFFLVNNLAHVDIQKGGLMDGLRLWCAIDDLLSHR